MSESEPQPVAMSESESSKAEIPLRDLFKLKKVNLLCWKLYIGEVFCGSHPSEEVAKNKRDVIIKAILATNTTTRSLRGSAEQVETGRVTLSGVQDHGNAAQIVGGRGLLTLMAAKIVELKDRLSAQSAEIEKLKELLQEMYDMLAVSHEEKDGVASHSMWLCKSCAWRARAAEALNPEAPKEEVR